MLDDFEVLGIAGQRRQKLPSESEPRRLRLHRHLIPPERRDFYDAVLQETLAWLKPAEIISTHSAEAGLQFLQNRLLEDFKLNFPKTFALLGVKAAAVLEAYLAAFPWQGLLLTDHFRYFSLFLKQEKFPVEFVWTAQHEWLLAHLSFNDFGEPRCEEGILRINPSLQIFTVPRNEGSFQAGLYVYWRDLQSLNVLQAQLSAEDAEILDALGEERKFRAEQVLSHLALEQPSDREDEKALKAQVLKEKLLNLIDRGIILDN